MGLFGFGKKKQKEREQDVFEQQLKTLRSVRNPSPTLRAIINLMEAGHNRDQGEWAAAMSQRIECPECHYEFVMSQGWKKSDTSGTLQCPNCEKSMYAQVYAPE